MRRLHATHNLRPVYTPLFTARGAIPHSACGRSSCERHDTPCAGALPVRACARGRWRGATPRDQDRASLPPHLRAERGEQEQPSRRGVEGERRLPQGDQFVAHLHLPHLKRTTNDTFELWGRQRCLPRPFSPACPPRLAGPCAASPRSRCRPAPRASPGPSAESSCRWGWSAACGSGPP